MKKRALVTGGAGFIGSHLIDSLVGDGYEVIAMDNFFTGSRDNLSHHFIPKKDVWGNLVEAPGRVEIMRHDVCEPFHLDVDEIYHLACPASPVHYQRNPVRTIETCVLGTSNALRCARDVGAKIFIASTSEVYGDPLEHPQTERYWGNVNPVGPRACYDEGKRAAEALAFSYLGQHKIDVRLARIFNTYGPRMHPNDGRVVSNFLVQALARKPLTIYGAGEQTRSFCYVTDLVDAIRKYMSLENLSYRIVNLGNPEEVTINQLIGVINTIAPCVEVVNMPSVTDDPTRRKPDISRAVTMLGWTPQVSLRKGLLETYVYFRKLQEKGGF